MQILLFRRLSLVSLLVVAVGPPEQRTCADTPSPVPAYRQAIKFACGNAPSLQGTYMAGARTRSEGGVEAFGVMTLGLPGVDQPAGLRTITYFPNLTVGDVAPIFGNLYCIDMIVDLGEPKGKRGKDWMTARLAEAKDLPHDVNFHQGSIGIPLNRETGGATTFNSNSVVVEVVAKLADADPGDGLGPAAEVKILESGPPPPGTMPRGMSVSKTTNAKVRRGDTVTIDKHPMKVRSVVACDPKRHIVGWVELDPGPPPAPKTPLGGFAMIVPDALARTGKGPYADTFPDILRQLLVDALVGTGPSLEKLLAVREQRTQLVVPISLWGLLTSWPGECSIKKAEVDFSADAGEASLTWNLEVLFPRDPDETTLRIDHELERARFIKRTYRPATAHLRDLYDKQVAAGGAPARQFKTLVRERFGAMQEVALLDGIRASREMERWSLVGIEWTIARPFRGEPPTLKELLGRCPWLKAPYLEAAILEKLQAEPVFAYRVSFPKRMSHWMVEISETNRAVIESLLRHDGFEAQERTVQLRPPYWPAGTEQHFWYRSSNWTHASLISLPGKKRVQFVFQAPQKGEPNVDKGDGVDSGGH